MHQEGVTLIELLVTLSVVAIIVAVGAPALRDFFAMNRMSAAVNDLVTSLHLARSEAIKRNAPTVLCPSDDWNSANPTCTAAASLADGWIVVADPNNNAIVVQTHEPLPGSLLLQRDFDDAIGFSANGQLDDNLANADNEFNLLLCDSRGDREAGGGLAAGRWINVRSTGRPRIYAQQTDVQRVEDLTTLGGCQT